MKTILAGFLALGMALNIGVVAAQAATVYTPTTGHAHWCYCG